MNLSVGIVGLPNVGKSTLFNALLKKQQAFVANFPFATIEPNVGVVPVPDARLALLAHMVQATENLPVLPPLVPATVEFVDIAGLIAGAHKGEGLGNKFLSHIRQTDAICHVVRAFTDANIIKEGSVDPKKDFETVETELLLADLETLDKQKSPGMAPDKELQKRWAVVQKFRDALGKGVSARMVALAEGEMPYAHELHLLTAKPILVALNVDESDLLRADELEERYAKELSVTKDQVVAICAKTEMELAGLSEEEQQEYCASIGIAQSGLERIITKAFATLGLMTFLTAGEKEVRAWTIKKHTPAPQASAAIHTDFEKNFIRMDAINWKILLESGGWVNARQKGLIRSEGKGYIVQDGDVIIVKHNA